MFDKSESSEASASSTIIGKGTKFEGTAETAGNFRVEGEVHGTIKCKSKVALGDSAKVVGNIFAKNAEIDGEVKGKLEISDLLILGSKSVIHGDIITNNLIVKDGASFNGECSMGSKVKEVKLNSDVNDSKTKPMFGFSKQANG